MGELINGGFVRHKIVGLFVGFQYYYNLSNQRVKTAVVRGLQLIRMLCLFYFDDKLHVCTNVWLGHQGIHQRLEFFLLKMVTVLVLHNNLTHVTDVLQEP